MLEYMGQIIMVYEVTSLQIDASHSYKLRPHLFFRLCLRISSIIDAISFSKQEGEEKF